MPKRKVFAASLGFYDTVIAAPSKISALAAWGAKYDLFKYGGAQLASDPEAVKAALAKPGLVLRRPIGSNEPYSEHPDQPSLKQVLSQKSVKRKKTKPSAAAMKSNGGRRERA